jgi:O-acetyl-ADP-ribose deacetylase (regulator of RNase III)
MSLKFTTGDATAPIGTGTKIIVHICNDLGGWGKGFVLAISKRWKAPEKAYRKWHKGEGIEDFRSVQFGGIGSDTNLDSDMCFDQGRVQFVKVAEEIWVANMIAQQGMKAAKDGTPPIRYEAVAESLARVAVFAMQHEASIHMPRIGCGLAGGKWEEIEPIIQAQLIAKGLEVVVYDFG